MWRGLVHLLIQLLRTCGHHTLGIGTSHSLDIHLSHLCLVGHTRIDDAHALVLREMLSVHSFDEQNSPAVVGREFLATALRQCIAFHRCSRLSDLALVLSLLTFSLSQHFVILLNYDSHLIHTTGHLLLSLNFSLGRWSNPIIVIGQRSRLKVLVHFLTRHMLGTFALPHRPGALGTRRT